MSTDEEDKEVSVCANCGKGEEESDKLKSCTACKLVKYCSRDCQIAHRPQHKRECRKRAAELHDEKLFKQPPPEGDCPICFIRLPTLETRSKYMTCCGKTICSGCIHAPLYDHQGNEVDNKKCPFCRTPHPKSNEEAVERTKKRMEANDAKGIFNLACNYYHGKCGLPQDYTKALELYHRAAKLSHTDANVCVAYAYETGRGVDFDKKKSIHHCELAAMGGSVIARYNLGVGEVNAGNHERALRHWMIASRDGYSQAVKDTQTLYSNGHATKEDYTKALQLYQTYLVEIKSDQRDKAASFNSRYRYY